MYIYYAKNICPFLIPAECPISLMGLLKTAPRWTKKRKEREQRDTKAIIQSILPTEEQHLVLDFREGGKKRQDVVG